MEWHYVDGGRTAGPVSEDQLKDLLHTGALSSETLVWKEGMNDWVLLSAAGLFPSKAAAAGPDASPLEDELRHVRDAEVREQTISPATEAAFRSGANWFYWIGGLSLVNAFIALVGGGLYFVVGLGISSIIDGVGLGMSETMGQTAKVIAFALNGVLSACVCVIGYLASQRILWVYIGGMVLYSIDALVLLFFADWFSFAFHCYALFGLGKGILALMNMRKV